MKKAKAPERDASNDWLTTYSDLVTLLMTFFVMLYAGSTVDEQKWQYIISSFKSMSSFDLAQYDTDVPALEDGVYILDDFPTVDPSELDNNELPGHFDFLYGYINKYIGEFNLGEGVEVTAGQSYVHIRFQSGIFFDPDSAALKKEGVAILKGIVPALQKLESSIKSITITGHTADAISDTNSWDLAGARASSVLKYLDFQKAVPSNKFRYVSRGSYDPIADNATEEGKAKNRRVEIMILRNDIDTMNLEMMKEILKIDYGIDIDSVDPENPNSGKNPDKFPEGSTEYIIDKLIEQFGQNPVLEFNPDAIIGPSKIDISDVLKDAKDSEESDKE